MSMDHLAQFLDALDTPSKAIAGLVVFMGIFAMKFFPPTTPIKVRLLVFSVVAVLSGGAMVLQHRLGLEAADHGGKPAGPADEGASSTPASTPSSSWELLPWGVAHAQSAGGWAYVGRWDEAKKQWLEGPDLEGLAGRLPREGGTLTVSRALDLYLDQPRFNVMSQQWRLGERSGRLEAGQRVRIEGGALLVGPNVWVRVSRIRG